MRLNRSNLAHAGRPGSGLAAVGLSSIPQKHGGALLAGGVPGHKGANQYTVRQRVEELRGQLIAELEGAAKDLSALLETARESDGDRLRCKACVGPSFQGALKPYLTTFGN